MQSAIVKPPPYSKPATVKGYEYVATWNNPRPGAEDFFDAKTMTFAVVGKEVSSTGTPHLQIYVQFKPREKPYTRRWVSKKYFSNAWCTPAHASPSENLAYCSKDNNYKTFGEMRFEKYKP